MLANCESEVCGVSLIQLQSTSLMWTALDREGRLLHMAPAFAQLLLGEGAQPAEHLGATLAQFLGENYGGERMRIAQRASAMGYPIVTRSVMRGQQYVSHFHPAVRRDDGEQIVVVFHQAIEGPIAPCQFPGSEYVEAAHNRYGRLAALSPREVEVAAYLSQGLDAKQIAQAMTRSLETITSHKKSLYLKLGVASQLQAMLIIRRAGLTSRDASRIALEQRLGGPN